MSYFYWPYRPLPGSHLPGHSIFQSPVGLLASTPVLTTNSVSMFFQHTPAVHSAPDCETEQIFNQFILTNSFAHNLQSISFNTNQKTFRLKKGRHPLWACPLNSGCAKSTPAILLLPLLCPPVKSNQIIVKCCRTNQKIKPNSNSGINQIKSNIRRTLARIIAAVQIKQWCLQWHGTSKQIQIVLSSTGLAEPRPPRKAVSFSVVMWFDGMVATKVSSQA